MRLYTITPIRTGYRLAAGITPATDQHRSLTSRLRVLEDNEFTLIGGAFDPYGDISRDGFDLRVAVFMPDAAAGAPKVRYHIYGSGVAVAEVEIEGVDPSTPDLQAWGQRRSGEELDRYEQTLCDLLKRMGRLTGEMLDGEPDDCGALQRGHTSRTLILSETERGDPAFAGLIRSWLAETTRPEDADAILAGTCDHSMTWLNYMIVETDRNETGFLLATMRVAQYFWAAHDWANERTRQIVADALTVSRPRRAERELVAARARMQMLQIEYESLRAVLTRRKERMLREILELWSFEALKTNGDRLIDLSSGKIREITSARTRSSEFVTEFILFAIGAVAIVEMLLAAVSFSREVALRPALEYTDEGGSRLLNLVAAADSDAVLGSGLAAIVLLTVIYVLVKRR